MGSVCSFFDLYGIRIDLLHMDLLTFWFIWDPYYYFIWDPYRFVRIHMRQNLGIKKNKEVGNPTKFTA